MKVKISAIFLFGLLNMAGCSSAQQSGEVIAEVNGSKLTYEFLLDQFPEEYRSSMSGEQLSRAVEAWIETELLYQEGLKHTLDKDQRVKNILEQKRKDIIAARFIDLSISSEIDVRPEEVDSIYNSQRDVFKNREEMLNLSHIVLNTKGAAEAIYSRLKSGDDFSALAADFSEDVNTRKTGGDLGFLPVSAIEEAMVKGISKIEIGQFTPPIKGQSGFYHIFLLKDRKAPGTVLPLEEIRQDIIESIKAERQQSLYNDLIGRLRESADIKRYPLDE